MQVQNLVEGTTYEFRVTAENKAGRSQPSPVSDPVVIREPVGKLDPYLMKTRPWLKGVSRRSKYTYTTLKLQIVKIQNDFVTF